jgi:DNA-binding transcriptional LysR family regulator
MADSGERCESSLCLLTCPSLHGLLRCLAAEAQARPVVELGGDAVELAARVGLRAGRVRLAGFQTVLSTLVPKAAAELSRSHPGIELNLVDAHPVEGLKLLRSGHVDIAVVFRHARRGPGQPRA